MEEVTRRVNTVTLWPAHRDVERETLGLKHTLQEQENSDFQGSSLCGCLHSQGGL